MRTRPGTGKMSRLVAAVVAGAAGVLSNSGSGHALTHRRGHEARRGLTRSRRETAAVRQDRDDLLGQRDAARDRIASAHVNGSSPAGDVLTTTSSPAK